MWIRSQHRTKLINANHLICDYVLGSDNEYYIANLSGFERCILGNYSSKEKALKVLDEIEEMICCGNDYYQIPDEEDVDLNV